MRRRNKALLKKNPELYLHAKVLQEPSPTSYYKMLENFKRIKHRHRRFTPTILPTILEFEKY
jgi:hypothetical protein